MTDTEKITSAKEFIDKLAQGISPLTNMPADDGDIINDIRISRCLFYVSSILEKALVEEERNTAKKDKSGKDWKRRVWYLSTSPMSNFPATLSLKDRYASPTLSDD